MSTRKWSPILRLPSKLLSIVLVANIAGGCSSFTKTPWKDLKPISLVPTKINDASSEPRTKPLTIKEQRKLCLSTAEQLVQSQHWAEAVKLFEKAEALGKPGQSLDRELAPAYAANGQFPQAIDRYQKLLAKNPRDIDLEINLAWTLMESGDSQSAEQHLRNAISKQPSNPSAISNLAVLMTRTGRTPEAFELFKQVVSESAAHHNIGVLMLDLGHEEAARVAFENAVASPGASAQSKQFLAALQSPGIVRE